MVPLSVVVAFIVFLCAGSVLAGFYLSRCAETADAARQLDANNRAWRAKLEHEQEHARRQVHAIHDRYEALIAVTAERHAAELAALRARVSAALEDDAVRVGVE